MISQRFDDNKVSINKRIRLFSLAIAVFIFALIVRLYYWQVIKADDLRVRAEAQYGRNLTLQASRGSILSLDNTWLTSNTTEYELDISLPDITDDKDKIADKLASIFIDKLDLSKSDRDTLLLSEASRIKLLLSKPNSVWVSIKKDVTKEQKVKIEENAFKGLSFDDHESRMYPEGSIAAQLLGFVGKDSEGNDKGYFGLEGYYDSVLKGKSGFEYRQADVRGVPLLFDEFKKIDKKQGVDLITSVDKAIQIKSELKLREGIQKYGAKSGSVVILEPKTGSVIAMASWPSFDPDKYTDYGNDYFLNPVISSSFEPGSVFKIIAMAAGLDANVISPDTKCDICDKPFVIGKYTINTWDNKYHAETTMTDVIVHSDNVGMTFVGFKLGKDKFIDYLESFGFGSKTGIDLEGEMTPKLRDSWGEIDLATATFGQGIAVTPIQLASAVCTIANDGLKVKPHVVSALRIDDWKQEIDTEEGDRVISKKAADEITAMMAQAAKNGEAKWTNLSGYKVAGKTGTAQIPISGHYDETKTIASFVGFAPYDDPKFVMLVTLKEPQSSQWASETAAPLWFSIAKDLFYKYGIQPDRD